MQINLLNPVLNLGISNPIIKPKSPIFSTFIAISHTFPAQTSIICARKKKRRSGFQRSTKLALQLASLLAPNLNILPPPLDLVVAELSGGDGNGGGSRLWRGFGRGGGDGWRGKRKIMIPIFIIGVLIVSGVALLLFTDFEINEICGVLGFAVFSIAFIQLLLKTAISKGFVWGFGLLIAFELRKWVAKLGVYSPNMKCLRSKMKGKRIF